MNRTWKKSGNFNWIMARQQTQNTRKTSDRIQKGINIPGDVING